jgi:glycerol uptake facilitator-like aquaporin
LHGVSALRWPSIPLHKFPVFSGNIGIFTTQSPYAGAHLNPAISLAQLLKGSITPVRFLLYLPAQLVGAFLGSALAFLGHFG